MDYKPYSPEWHRKRCLREAINDYLNSGEANKFLYQDIVDILNERINSAQLECKKVNDLKTLLNLE